ncbi:YqgE/AlgH family protein [Yoonia litorea]|nr:YqgE/AlgH family protein [Yoonia litorea]
MTTTVTKLTGKLLIAMPDMSDPRFAKSVIFMCDHSAEGGMGLVINRPKQGVSFSALLEQLEIAQSINAGPFPRLYDGGPVEQQRGFVLHSSDYRCKDGTLEVDESFRMTATLKVLEDIGRGEGPKTALMTLGYAGWGPGQLEFEISRNGWLTCDPNEELVFHTPDDQKWSASLKMMGIDPLLLSATAGRA